MHQQDPPGLHLPLPVDSDLDWAPVAGARTHLGPRVIGAVFAGGCLGGLARYGVTLALPAGSDDWPWAVLLANTSGAFLLGLLLVLVLELWQGSGLLRPFAGTGFCGGFTTMSSVVVTTDRWVADGSLGQAAGYLVTTVVVGLLAATAGLLAGRLVVVRRGAGPAARS